jgi:hypothetical protein
LDVQLERASQGLSGELFLVLVLEIKESKFRSAHNQLILGFDFFKFRGVRCTVR